ncbi:SDR family oxidoreductase [Paraburkholderia dipogonis]|uniref:SDR family oxidoreductase n=1 Tax=Paraburkholderia dipogonis TaxID=1211383 RepID=A0A4Y8MKY3_9BURK|nr:SDR family oxidoreductase [Paraburkholderia dipogonis]TFE38084.1 SDR family oxidoreductase [Paraburkholderia dipogonis]
MKHAGKVAIVTGGTAGIGNAIAKRFALEGAHVVIADINNATEAAAEISETGPEALGVSVDISSESDVETLISSVIGKFGHIDILVNNAAMFGTPKPFEEIGAAEWRRMMEVNTLGPYLLCCAVAPHMRKRKDGRVINIVSSSAQTGIPYILHYVASKGAMIAFTRSLAHELGNDNITVNAIAPGFTLSSRIANQSERVDAFRKNYGHLYAIKRDGVPDDLAGAASFLAGVDASFITGQTLIVDGGMEKI